MSGKAGSGRRALTMSDRDLVKKAKGLGALGAKVIGPAAVQASRDCGFFRRSGWCIEGRIGAVRGLWDRHHGGWQIVSGFIIG